MTEFGVLGTIFQGLANHPWLLAAVAISFILIKKVEPILTYLFQKSEQQAALKKDLVTTLQERITKLEAQNSTERIENEAQKKAAQESYYELLNRVSKLETELMREKMRVCPKEDSCPLGLTSARQGHECLFTLKGSTTPQ